MAQVTIYLEEDALRQVKAAATAANMSVSKWFAKLALQASPEHSKSNAAFWQRIDTLRQGEDDETLDFLLDQSSRHADLGQDSPRPVMD